jgi:glycine dehydrogenase subunit 2
MMIEPTETESKADLDRLIEALMEIDRLAKEDAGVLHEAPSTTVIGRVDEVLAARKPVVRW